MGKQIKVMIWLGVVAVFFWKYWFKGLVPMPGDIITGLYYPWLDYKWGNVVGVAVRNPLMSDVPSLIYPWRILAVELMKNREWPLWNQYSFSGSPLLGNWQSAVFSMSSWLMVVLGNVNGWSAGVMLQPLLGMVLMYVWLRSKRLKSLAAGLGGILFAFNGFQITWMYYNTHGWVVVWLPLMLLAVDKIFEGSANLPAQAGQNFRQWKWGWWLAMMIALAVLAGYPILLIYEAMVVMIYVVWKIGRKEGKLGKREVLIIGLALIGGLGLSAVQWVPGWETIQNSIHQTDSSTLAAVNSGFLPWEKLITGIAPDFFGNPTTYNYWGQGYYDNWAWYMSVGGLFLALLGWMMVKEARVWLAVAGLGLIFATDNQIGNWLREVSGVLQGSIPARGLLLVTFSMAVAASYGMDVLLREKVRMKWLVVTLLVIAGWLGWLWWVTGWGSGLGKNFVVHQAVAMRNLVVPTGITIVLVFLIGGWWLVNSKFKIQNSKLQLKDQNWSVVICQLLLLLIVADLFRYGWKYLPFTPREYLYPQTEVLTWLQEKKKTEEPFRVEFGETVPANMWMPYRLESPTGYDALLPARYGVFLEAVVTGKPGTGSSRFPTIWRLDSRLFDLTNTRYVLALKYDEVWKPSAYGQEIKERYELEKLVPVYEYGTVEVLENKSYFPRAFVVGSWETIQDDGKLIEKMINEGTNLREVVFFDEAGSPPYEACLRRQGGDGGGWTGTVEWLKSEGQSRELKVTADKAGYLVVLENYDEGWRAEVNGKKFKPRRVDFTFMAVPVELGENVVKLWYWPESFGWGLGVSGGVLVMWVITGVWLWKTKKLGD